MALRAVRIKRDGTEEVVDARTLTEANRGDCFRCVGTCQYGPHKGETCKANMTLFLCTEKDNYFSATGSSAHKKGCEYCEKRKEKTIQILNRSCRDKTDMDILLNIQGKAADGGGKPFRPGGRIGGTKIPNDDEETEDDEELVVRRTHRLPKNADELYEVLTEFSPDDYFTQKQVSKWMVDKRTFAHYYSEGLEDGQIALVILGKMSSAKLPEELKAYSGQYFVFTCSGQNWREKMYFLLPKGGFSGNNLFDPQIKQFAILAAWKRAETTVPAYYCDTTPNQKQVTFMPNTQVNIT